MDNLFLLDVSGFIHRAYHAMQNMASKEGEATGALFGFIRSIIKLDEDFQHPKTLVAIFDGPHSKESRLAIYKEYKANREKAPQDLIHQIIEAERFCHLYGIPVLSLSGVEADDTIASVTRICKHKAHSIYICSQDKDLAQLVDDSVFVLNQHKAMVIDTNKVEELWGVLPQQIHDYLSICGDASDNIPGIRGFGPKTAVDLLKKYHTLAGIYEHIDEISGKKKETLLSEKENAFLSHQLVALNDKLDVPTEISFYERKTPNFEGLKTFYQEKGFLSLLKLIPSHEKQETARYHIVNSEKELESLIEELSKHKEIVIDTETTSEHPIKATIVGIGLAATAEDIYYIPCNGNIDKKKIIHALHPLITNPHIGFIGHNIKYDFHILKNEGLEIKKIAFDTMIASYLLNAHMRRHSLDELSLEYFGKKKIATSDLIGSGKKAITMNQVPIEKVGEYCCEDVLYTSKLHTVLHKELKARNLEALLHDIEIPLIPILAKMERHGMFLDVEVLQTLSTKVTQEIAACQQAIFALSGEEFNINSPKQLSEVLFTKLLLPLPTKRGKEMPSTSIEVLEALADAYPIAQKIIEYRALEKLRSTYIDALPAEIFSKTGRIHTQFNQSVAATGRLSSQEPNLQNIPIRTELGKEIRKAFRPENCNYVYVSADYSQIELRLLAHMSQEENLIHAFEQGLDVHTATAARLLHKKESEVTEDERRHAKVVNFGVIYGQGPFGLAQELHIPFKEAARFIEEYYTRYPKVKAFIEHAKTLAKNTGKATTLTGRERLIPDINSTNQALRAAAERLAVNTPLQGTAADIIKIAMIKMDHYLSEHKLKSTLILQVHDELIFEAPRDEVEELKEGIRSCMEHVVELTVPLTTQISVGKNWKEC